MIQFLLLIALGAATNGRVLPGQGYPENLGPNFAGMQQAPYQETAEDEEFQTLVKAGGPYSGAYAAESVYDDNQDIIGYMSMPSQMDDIPIVAMGHDISEHNRLLHDAAETSHDSFGLNRMDGGDDDDEVDELAVAQQHDALVDKSIHSLSGINVEHDEVVHQHVHPDEQSRLLADAMNMQKDQRGFGHMLDQLTLKMGGSGERGGKQGFGGGEGQFEYSPHPGDPSQIPEGLPFEGLLKGGSYYESIGRKYQYITSTTAITVGALIGVIFLLLGCLIAIVYCRGWYAVLDFFLCLLGFSCLMPIPLPPDPVACGNKGNCCPCSVPPKYPKVLKEKKPFTMAYKRP